MVARINYPAESHAHQHYERQDHHTQNINPIGLDDLWKYKHHQQSQQDADQCSRNKPGQVGEDACEIKRFQPAPSLHGDVPLELLLFDLGIALLDLTIADRANASDIILEGYSKLLQEICSLRITGAQSEAPL